MNKFKISVILLLAVFHCLEVYAQPANDACAGNIPVPLNGTCTSGTTVGATDNWTGTVGCQAANNPEVWYSFVADSTNISIIVTAGTMTGNIEFILVQAAFPTCIGPLTLQGSSCGPSVLTDSLYALTVGQTYLFTISSSTGGNGTFTVCITSFEFPPVTAGDCVEAVDVCTNFGFQIQPAGFGSVMEIPPLGSVGNPLNNNPGGSGNWGCLQANPPERNSTWMIVNVNGSGLLQFTFGGNGTQAGYYDWIMYPWNPNVCTDIPTGNYAPVRCNWNGVDFGGTGLASTVPVGGNASNYEPPLPVICGEKYIICFSNWSSVVTTVPLDFYGTASVTCFPEELTVGVIPPNPVICPGGSVTLTASGADTYTWSPSAGLSDTTGTSVVASPSVTTTYTVKGTTGCFTGDTTITVVVQPIYAGFTFTGSQCLSTNNINFTNTGAPAGSCGINCPVFTWDFGDGTGTTGTSPAAASPTHTYTSGGTFNVTQTVSDSNCTDVYSINITISDPYIILIGTEESCFGGCDGAADLTVTGGVNPYTYSWSPGGQTTEDIIDICAGTYTVNITDAYGCFSSGMVTLNPIVDVTAGFSYNGNQCLAGNYFIFTNTGDAPGSCGANCPAFWWDFGDGNTLSGTNASAANPSHTYLTTGTFIVKQALTDERGCTDTVIRNIVVFAAPVASVNGNDESCIGACNGSATLTVTGGVPVATYAWSNGGTTQNLTGLCNGDYSVIVIDTNGCRDSASVTINIGTDIKAGFTHNGNQCLSGNNFVFTNTGTTPGFCGGSCPTFTWDFGDLTVISGTTPSDANPVHTYSSSGIFTVMQVISNGLCSDTLLQTIVVSPQPTITIVPVDVSCGACDGSADLTVVSGTPPFTYNWSNFETAQDLNGVCSGTYAVTVTDSNRCAVTGSVVISQGAGFVASVSKTDVSCNGGNDGTATVNISGGVPPFTYSWSNGDSSATADSLAAGTYFAALADSSGCYDTIYVDIYEPAALLLITDTVGASCGVADGIAAVIVSGGTSPYTYLWNDPAQQTTDTAYGVFAGVYKVIVTDSAGCTDSATAIVNNIGAPIVTASLISNVKCSGGNDGQATVVASTGTPPFTYLWDDPSTQTTDTAFGLTAGFYSVTVEDAGGCIGIDTITISQPASLTGTLTVTNISCFGADDGSLCVTVNGGVPPYTYNWCDGTVDSCITGSPAISNCCVNVTDANGCVLAPACANITEPAQILVTTDSTNVICNGYCNGDAAVFVSGGTGSYTYLWDDPAGQTNDTATGLCAGNYNVVISDLMGCTETADIQIAEPPPVILSITGTNASCKMFCNGTSTVTASGSTPPYNYIWDDPLAQTESTATGLCVATYSVTVTDFTGCSQDTFYTVTQDPWAPVADFDLQPNPTTIFEPTITFTNLSFPDIDSLTYQWNFGDGTTGTLVNPVHVYNDTGTFTVQLTVYDSDSCMDTTTKILVIKGEYIIFVPNSFTPNEDGYNELFLPKGIGIDNNNYELFIFDRWGDEIFRTTDPFQGWDGRANNGRELAQQDVYVWLILSRDNDGMRHRYAGHVTLIR